MTFTAEGLLIAVKDAAGPDLEIDAALMDIVFTRDERHIGAQEDSGPGGSWVPVKEHVWVDPETDQWVSTAPHRFTSSIDAIVALIERELPGWAHAHIKEKLRGCIGYVHDNSKPYLSGMWFEERAATPALALCAAFLQAKIVQGAK